MNMKQIGLLWSSLIPLHGLLTIRFALDCRTIEKLLLQSFDSFQIADILVIYLIVSTVGGATYALFFLKKSAYIANNNTNRIQSIEDITKINIEFFITLIFPFALYDSTSTTSVIMCVCILTVLYAFICKSEYYYANPVLFLLGFRTYNVRLDGSNVFCLICKKELKERDSVALLKITEDIAIAYKASE